MPKTPQDFSKGLIYSIVCKTDETLLYVGSTTNFTQRKNKHKTTCCNEKSKKHNLQVYVMIRANGGWHNFDMKPVKEFPCESKIQLVIEEERIRKEMKANLNTIRAYRSPEERKEQNKELYKKNKQQINEHQKQHYEKNKQQINERHKQYNKDNTEKIVEYRKQYREANAEELAEYAKQYREAHQEQQEEYAKQYYEKNKQQIAEQKKIYNEKNKQQTIDRAKQYYQANKQQILERRKIKKEERKNTL